MNSQPDNTTLAPWFSLPVKAKRSRVTIAIFPCGTEWPLEKDSAGEWSCPIYRGGEQTSLTACADTLRGLKADLATEGCTFRQETR